MKNSKFRAVLLVLLLFGFGGSPSLLMAQAVPPFYNQNSSTYNENLSPYGVNPYSNGALNKVQYLHPPLSFRTGGLLGDTATLGIITKIYIRLGFTINDTATYSDFTISLAQNRDTQTVWTSTSWNTGMNICFYQEKFKFNGATQWDWYAIDLQTPFVYDPQRSLVVELKNSWNTGNNRIAFFYSSLLGNSWLFGNYNASNALNKSFGLPDLGFNLKLLELHNVTYKSHKKVELEFYTIPDSFNYIYIWRSLNSSSFLLHDSVIFTSGGAGFYLDSVGLTDTLCYYLTGIDSLNNSYYSDTLCPVTLSGLSYKDSVKLKWSTFRGYYIDSVKVLQFNNNSWDTIRTTLESDNEITIPINDCKERTFKLIGLETMAFRVTESDSISVGPIDTILPPSPEFKCATTDQGKVTIAFDTVPEIYMKKYSVFKSTNNSAFVLAGDSVPHNVQPNYYSDTSVSTRQNRYCYYLKTINNCDNSSLPSDTHCLILLQGQPANLSTHLQWYPYIGFDVGQYYIQRLENNSWQTIDSVLGIDTAYFDDSLECNTNYIYRIQAQEISGNRFSESDTIHLVPFDTIPPAAPALLSATVTGNSTINLFFESVADTDVNRYLIFSNTNGSRTSNTARNLEFFISFIPFEQVNL